MPKQNVVLAFHVIHLSHNNFINPVVTDMNQSVLADIRPSSGLPPKMKAKIEAGKKMYKKSTCKNCNPYEILV